jgi:hypothetical protein
MGWRQRAESERGALLVHVAVILAGFTAFSALVVDVGMLLASRRQIQNAADSAALGAAVALAYDDPFDQTSVGPATEAALAFAANNEVWNGAPAVSAGDVTFPICPDGVVPPMGDDGSVRARCVEVAAARDAAHGNPLSTFFAPLFGISTVDVRATATAQVVSSYATDCLKPWAIPDKWKENFPLARSWNPTLTFNKYNGGGVPLVNPDVYQAPSLAGIGTGLSPLADYGRELTLAASDPSLTIVGNRFLRVGLSRADGTSGDSDAGYQANIQSCTGVEDLIGDTLTVAAANPALPTSLGVQALIAQDSAASWDSANGRVIGGCMSNGDCVKSPRIVALPVYNPDAFETARRSGGTTITVTNIVGFFVDRLDGGNIVGYLVHHPGLPTEAPRVTDDASFLKAVELVQ